MNPSGVVSPSAAYSAGQNTALATSASSHPTTSSISFFVPFNRPTACPALPAGVTRCDLLDPPASSPGHNVFASSFAGAIVDIAPGGPGADLTVRPRHGEPYTILRSGAAEPPPTAHVGLSVDGGPETPAVLTGSSPSYTWSGAVDATTLADGAHTITSTLYLNGIAADSNSVQVFVQRTQTFTHEVVITSPANGSTVPRATVEVRGTAASDAPAEQARAVTLQITDAATGGTVYDSGELAATGTSPWTVNFDFGTLDAGNYDLLARFYVGGGVVDTDAVTVTVPVPEPGGGISCAPRGLGFWRDQYEENGTAQKFSDEEAETLAFHAVGLSDGYFENTDELRAALFARGNPGPERRAARAFAALLLNLSGGDLSGVMSYRVGLSGAERLGPTYDTGTLGPTVDSAADWIRDQLPNGNLGGANEVGTALNEGVDLQC
ncbi:MAG: Ig-like domain-containing protein [Actinomycetota bacterium]|nr:Ig-like domain-containing protein [Actinomycetota bacterium]